VAVVGNRVRVRSVGRWGAGEGWEVWGDEGYFY